MQSFKLIFLIASLSWVPFIGSQPIPILEKVFVLSNGGPIHWHETVTRGTIIMNELASGANPDNHSFEIFVTASVSDITAANLSDVDVLVLNNVSGVDRLLTTAQKQVVENFVANGGGIHGWHATTDIGSVSGWPWFVNWISTNYIGSSGYGRAAPMFKDEDISQEHEYILGHWDDRVDMIGEEWYQFANPHPEDNPNTTVLMRVDGSTISSNQPSLPMIWVNEEKNGRLWASGLGHFEALMARDDIVEMFYRGLVYAAGGYVENVPPDNLNFSSGLKFVYSVGNTINANTMSYSGSELTNVSIDPALPQGLILNTTNGTLSGTPVAESPSTNYLVVATNPFGTTSISINLQVEFLPPTNLAYSQGIILAYQPDKPVTQNTLSYTGSMATTITISPGLPAGLQFSSTGTISGTPSSFSASAEYIVTVSNQKGSDNIQINLVVDVEPITNVSYSQGTKLQYLVDNTLDLNLLSYDGYPANSITISPALPPGLTFNSLGVISGTPTKIAPEKLYTVTIVNSAGSRTIDINLEIIAHIPSNAIFSQGTSLQYTVNIPIVENIITYQGSKHTEITITPELPAGIQLNSQTGVITGTPTANTPSQNYLVTISNEAGSLNVTLNILVSDVVSIYRSRFPEKLSLQGGLINSHQMQILFAIPKSSPTVNLSILDVKGNQIKTLVNRPMKVGHKSVFWNRLDEKGESVPAGIYILRLITEDSNISQLINLLN